MATEVKLPKLGENVDTGVVSKILVSVGDSVTEDKAVIELETEKATVEVPASVGGIVREIHVKEGETIKVGQVILTVEEGAGAEVEMRPTSVRPTSDVGRYGRRTSDVGSLDVLTSDVQTSDEEAKRAAPPSYEKKVQPIRKEEPAPVAPQVAPETVAIRELAPAAPSVRRLARELGVDINEVTGSGPGGRISEEDVRNYARSIILNVSRPQRAPQPMAEPLPDFTQWGEVEREAMSGIRRKTAAHMRDAWLTIPHVTQFDKADITELESLRQRFSKKVEAAGGKLTITAIALKVAAAALKVFPQFNASLDLETEEIIYKKYYHIGVAVDTDHGLLVPVIRDVDKKNLLELSVELTQLAEKGRQRKIRLEEMQGGTFTITNLGGIGGSNFTPIVNSPEVAILGIARASREPIFVNGQFEPRLMLPLALSYDHRLIDGADGARFLRWVVEALQEPFLLALEG